MFFKNWPKIVLAACLFICKQTEKAWITFDKLWPNMTLSKNGSEIFYQARFRQWFLSLPLNEQLVILPLSVGRGNYQTALYRASQLLEPQQLPIEPDLGQRGIFYSREWRSWVLQVSCAHCSGAIIDLKINSPHAVGSAAIAAYDLLESLTNYFCLECRAGECRELHLQANEARIWFEPKLQDWLVTACLDNGIEVCLPLELHSVLLEREALLCASGKLLTGF